jgi:hypothetical protein
MKKFALFALTAAFLFAVVLHVLVTRGSRVGSMDPSSVYRAARHSDPVVREDPAAAYPMMPAARSAPTRSGE